jgi:4-amino-4-deoxy-L-arabinose transferase-like glycosyltransferase
MAYHDKITVLKRARRLVARRPAEALSAALLFLMAVNFLTVIPHKSLTTDEALLVPAGYYHLTTGDFRPVGEHPPLAKVLSAVPLLFTGTVAPPLEDSEAGSKGYVEQDNLYWTFWRANRERVDALSYWSRVPMIALTLGLGVLIFVYARRLFGARAAALSVALYSIEPTVLAHGRVVQTDIPAAFAFLLFTFTFYDYLRAPTLRRAVYVGLVSALAVVAKFSMVVLAPLLLATSLVLIFTARRAGSTRARFAAHAAAAALSALVAINAAYFFQTRTLAEFSLTEAGFSADFDARTARARAAVRIWLPKIVPADFVEGIVWQLGHSRGGHPAGLLGRYRDHGWWYYFPAAFALKTTLPFLLLSLAAVAWAAWGLSRQRLTTFLLLLVPLAFYTALLMASSINIGVRYFLPAYPFLFILGGALLDRLLGARARRVATLAVALALGWMGWEAARAYPNYMPYMNQLASRAPRWYYLSDSNVEWGDDLRGLAVFLRERGETRVSAALLGWNLLEIYGIEYISAFVPRGMGHQTRYVAIGACYLNGSVIQQVEENGVALSSEESHNFFDEYRRREPEAVLGDSIYVYRATDNSIQPKK